MAGQSRPKGTMWIASPEWKRKVQEAMAEQGVSRAELARRIKVSDAAVTQLFNGATPQSRLVPAIHKVLGMPPPTQSTSEADEDLTELIEIWKELSDAERKALWGTARVLARKK